MIVVLAQLLSTTEKNKVSRRPLNPIQKTTFAQNEARKNQTEQTCVSKPIRSIKHLISPSLEGMQAE